MLDVSMCMKKRCVVKWNMFWKTFFFRMKDRRDELMKRDFSGRSSLLIGVLINSFSGCGRLCIVSGACGIRVRNMMSMGFGISDLLL